MAYRICSRCLMDTSDPDIRFERSVCNHCTSFLYRKSQVAGGRPIEEACRELVAAIQRQGRKQHYDCIIGVSGGTDSTYLALAVKRLGLRPLAVHLDNGWDSELAVKNIESVLNKLEIDLFTNVLDWEEFRRIQLAFLRSSTPDLELPTDHAIRATLLKAAVKHRIPTILNGRNFSTEGILPRAWSYGPLDLKYIQAVYRRFGGGRLRSYTRLSLPQYLWITIVHRPRDIGILNYVRYTKRQALETLRQEFGWRDYGDKHYESIWTRFYQGYILPKKFGFDKRRAHLSVLVLNGEIRREEGLAALERNDYLGEQAAADREYVIKKFDLSEEEFERILAAPPKSYRDYPNNSRVFVPHQSTFALSALKALRKLRVLPSTLATNVAARGENLKYGD